jgi:hypothetical protein
MNSYPRREFLLRALAACGTPFLMPSAPVEALQKPQAGTAAAGYFGGHTDAARAIGEAYVRHLGLDTNAESIRKVSPGALKLIARASTQQDAISALGRAVRRDFQEGRSVQLEGWIVSHTEAELCALTLFPATN